MKIGILEYQGYHSAYVNTLAEIFNGHEVQIFNDRVTALSAAKDLDLLFVNTIKPLPADYMRWRTFKPKCTTLLTVHELRTDFTFMRKIIDKFAGICVPLHTMRTYLYNTDTYNGRVFVIPFELHDKMHKNTNNMYVVPGKIEKFRRDYELVFERMAVGQHWCFLGEPIGRYGQYVLERSQRLPYIYHSIQTYDSFVPADEYERVLSGCKAVVAPIRPVTIGHNRLKHEYYGVTKAFGSLFSAIKYGKPLLVPDSRLHSVLPRLKLPEFTASAVRKQFMEQLTCD